MRKAAVFPVPVCAWPAMSLPFKPSGRVSAWIGVQLINPASSMPRRTGSGNSSTENLITLLPRAGRRSGGFRSLRWGARAFAKVAREHVRRDEPDLPATLSGTGAKEDGRGCPAHCKSLSNRSDVPVFLSHVDMKEKSTLTGPQHLGISKRALLHLEAGRTPGGAKGDHGWARRTSRRRKKLVAVGLPLELGNGFGGGLGAGRQRRLRVDNHSVSDWPGWPELRSGG